MSMKLIKTEMKAVLPLEWQDFLVFAKPKLVFSRKTPRFVIYYYRLRGHLRDSAAGQAASEIV